MIDEASIINKANKRSSKFKTGFLTSGARLAFATLKQAFIIVLILYYLDSEYHI